MKQTTLQIRTEQEKINAIRICLPAKDRSLEQELAEYVDVLYRKYVPASVRDFIEKSDHREQVERRMARRKAVSGESGFGGADTREKTEDAAEGDCEGL